MTKELRFSFATAPLIMVPWLFYALSPVMGWTRE
jgi:hypothetical protein